MTDLIAGGVTLAQTASPWGALGVAWLTFRRSQKRDNDTQVAANATSEALTSSTVASIVAKVDSIFKDMKEEAERFRAHDKDCARDKERLAAHIEANTATIRSMLRTVSNLERRVGYAARDEAERDTRAKLTGEPAS